MQVFIRHPFSNKRELNVRSVRERNGWIEEARRSSIGESFWRDRCKTRCARDGHTYADTTSGDGGLYCTCCGDLTYDHITGAT